MRLKQLSVCALGLTLLSALPGTAATLYNNLTPNNLMAMASRPDTGGVKEIEAADDFLLGSQSVVNSASLIGLLVPGTAGTSSITDLVIEIYRVFPADSNTTRTPNVPTRANSPSDVAFQSRDSAAGELTFSSTVVTPTFAALNSVQAGGIHPSPLQNTGGNGPLTGQEVQLNITFTKPFNLPADHYFFIPQVSLSNGGQFYWLSGSRPITGAGTTPFAPDLQAWIRDADLAPDWLRVGADIVGGTNAPAFNAAFALTGDAVPEPSSVLLVVAGLALGVWRLRGRAA